MLEKTLDDNLASQENKQWRREETHAEFLLKAQITRLNHVYDTLTEDHIALRSPNAAKSGRKKKTMNSIRVNELDYIIDGCILDTLRADWGELIL